MYEVKAGKRKVYGEDITTYTREVISANILEAEAGTDGARGGGDNGARTYIRIQDKGSTQFEPKLLGNSVYGYDGIELAFIGDTELETVIHALKFITKVLEDQQNEVHD